MTNVLFEWASLLGRIILGGFFVMMGIQHFMTLEFSTQYVASKGVPAPKVVTIIASLMLLFGGLSILLGIYPFIGVLLLVTFLVPTSFTMHAFWTVEDQNMRMMEMVNFLKNMALTGALLIILLSIGEFFPSTQGYTSWPFSLDQFLFESS